MCLVVQACLLCCPGGFLSLFQVLLFCNSPGVRFFWIAIKLKSPNNQLREFCWAVSGLSFGVFICDSLSGVSFGMRGAECWFRFSCAMGSLLSSETRPLGFPLESAIFLGVASISILSSDPDLSREPPKTLGKQRSVFEKNDG